uniref:Ycf37 n=1 Tax=Chondria sp. (in: red algae) TaxID=1982705 RepID=A0A1Z1MCH0_9FLOR|nr:hypothetical protein [Chondria sp. (in: red algae)]
MRNDIFLFRLYIIIALFFLVPLSLMITWQIYYLLRRYILIYSLLNMFTKNKKFLPSYENYNSLFDIFLDDRKFFLCISFVEFLIHTSSSNINLMYILLAYCYQKSSFLYIAEYYYLKALDIEPQSKIALSGLVKIYAQLGNIDKLNYVNSQIDILDSNFYKV